MKTLGDYLDWAAEQFEQADLFYGHGTDNAWDEAVYLILSSLGLPINAGNEVLERPISAAEHELLVSRVEQRVTSQTPVAYLVNKAYFAGLEFYVDERVLIPRSPIAELILAGFEPWVQPENIHSVLELGAGSACIAIATALSLPEASVTAVDISKDALAVAERNIETYQLADRVQLLESDLYQACQKHYDLILANPPYVPQVEYEELPAEYRHEPKVGLVAADQGLELADKIISQAPDYLNDNGVLILEVGYTQEALAERWPRLPMTWLEFEHGGIGVMLITREQLLEGLAGE